MDVERSDTMSLCTILPKVCRQPCPLFFVLFALVKPEGILTTVSLQHLNPKSLGEFLSCLCVPLCS